MFPEMQANCWTDRKISAQELKAFRAFEVSPVRKIDDGCVSRCASGEAEWWTVYGVNDRGFHDALHDGTPEEVSAFLINAMKLCGEKLVGFSSDDWFCEPTEWVTLVENLSFEMARRVEADGSPDDPEGMADAMDSDPLAAIHEAFAAVAPGAQSERGGLDDPFEAFGEWGSKDDEVSFADF